MQTKSFDLQIKEAREDVPGIVAYASTFDRIPDAYGDVVAKGAFTGTLSRLAENGYNLPLLYGHVMDNPSNIIGTVTKAVEDDHGLLVEATFDMENPNAQQVRRAILAKAINKLSFAFSILDEAPVKLEDGTKANELRELEIYEVSIVVVPANPRAAVLSAKDAEDTLTIETSVETRAVDTAEATEPEPEEQAKTEEPIEAKAEEPMPEEKAEEAEAPEPVNPVSVKENTMDIETMNAIGGAQPAEKSLKDILAETYSGKGLSDGSRFSIATPEIKAATWMGTPTIQEYDRSEIRKLNVGGIASAFSTIAMSGNTYVYVPITPKEGAFAAVAEGAAKPLVDYNKTPVPVALNTYAGILKLSNQVLEDAEWLASEIQTQGEADLDYALDGAAYAAINGASGIGSFTATTDLVSDIIKAAAQCHVACGYRPDVIFANPVDIATAKVSARSLAGESFISDGEIDSIEVILDAHVTSGTAFVGVRRFLKHPVKGGRRVDIANQNEDDFTKNLVAVRLEERGAFVLVMPAAFVKIA